MWDLPGPGLEPVSPALAGGFLTTAPPERSQTQLLYDVESCMERGWMKMSSYHRAVDHTSQFAQPVLVYTYYRSLTINDIHFTFKSVPMVLMVNLIRIIQRPQLLSNC